MLFTAKQHFDCVNELSTRRSETVQSVFLLPLTSSSPRHSRYFVLLLFSGLFSLSRSFFFLTTTSWKNFPKMSPEGKKLLNIIILGFAFMFMFTAFQTCGNIEVGVSLNQSITQTNNQSILTSHVPQLTKKNAIIKNCPPSLSVQQTVIKSFNSTDFHGSGYTR